MLAIALEHLAAQYCNEAEQRQGSDWNTVDSFISKHPEMKRYHVILHHENIVEAESKFDALQDTIIGNTVVETAIYTLIELSENSRQQVID